MTLHSSSVNDKLTKLTLNCLFILQTVFRPENPFKQMCSDPPEQRAWGGGLPKELRKGTEADQQLGGAEDPQEN